MKGRILYVLVLFFAVCFFVQPVFAGRVSMDYFLSEFQAVRDYHRSIFDVVSPRLSDKNLKIYAYNVLKADYVDFKKIEPPEGYWEIKRKILDAMKLQMAALQYGIQGRPDAMRYWRKGDAEFEAVDRLLEKIQREGKLPPLLQPNFKPEETTLTPQQVANRYFLVRLTNREFGLKILQGDRNPARIDFTVDALRTQMRLLQESKYPARMTDIKNKMIRLLEMSLQWVDFVKARKPVLAAVKQNEMRVLLKQIDAELERKYGIAIPQTFVTP